MGLFEYFEELRHRSVGERNKFAFTVSLIITLFILIIWIINMSISDISGGLAIDPSREDRSPVSVITPDTIDSVKSGFWVIVGGIREGIKSIIDLAR